MAQPQAGMQPPGPHQVGGPPQLGPQHPQRPGPPQPGPPHPQPGQQHPPAGQQVASGAKELANGAKTYFANTVAPAAMGAAQTVSQRSGQAPGAVHWTIWSRFALPVLAFIGIISLFMPLASASYMGRSRSINYFSEDAPPGEGAVMLIAFLLVIGFSVASLVTGRKWALITAGVLAILVGLVGMLNGFGTAAAINGERYGSVGAGAIFLGLMGLGLIVSAIITFLPQKGLTAQQY
ncbi:hypothetical protein [Nocardiopsis aegyptia]